MPNATSFVRRLWPLVVFIGLIWVLHILNISLQGELTDSFGLVPRTLAGLDGILAMPLLHGSWGHLAANTPPLLVLGGLLLFSAPEKFTRATLIAIVVGGALTWLFARHSNHIGASGLIFAWFGFLVTLGLLERSWRTALAATAAVLMYGTPTLMGLTPIDSAVSWDGHMAGLAAGIITAWVLSEPRRRLQLQPAPARRRRGGF